MSSVVRRTRKRDHSVSSEPAAEDPETAKSERKARKRAKKAEAEGAARRTALVGSHQHFGTEASWVAYSYPVRKSGTGLREGPNIYTLLFVGSKIGGFVFSEFKWDVREAVDVIAFLAHQYGVRPSWIRPVNHTITGGTSRRWEFTMPAEGEEGLKVIPSGVTKLQKGLGFIVRVAPTEQPKRVDFTIKNVAEWMSEDALREAVLVTAIFESVEVSIVIIAGHTRTSVAHGHGLLPVDSALDLDHISADSDHVKFLEGGFPLALIEVAGEELKVVKRTACRVCQQGSHDSKDCETAQRLDSASMDSVMIERLGVTSVAKAAPVPAEVQVGEVAEGSKVVAKPAQARKQKAAKGSKKK